MNEELKNKFKNGMVPNENDFAELIDAATEKEDLSQYASKSDLPVVLTSEEYNSLENVNPDTLYFIVDKEV